MSTATPPPAPAAPPQPQPQPPKRNPTNTIIISSAAVLIAGIVTAGVVISDSRDNDDPTPTVVKAAITPPAGSEKTSPPSSPNQNTFKLGDTADINSEDGKFSAAALSYRDTGIRSGIPGLLESGQKWAIVEAKLCNQSSEVMTVSPFPWTLAYADGARVEATHLSGTDLPPPLYPMDAKVKAGDCVRGNITFKVPKESQAERVLYSPDVLDEPVEWKIGK